MATVSWLVLAWGAVGTAMAQGRVDLVRVGDRLRIVVPLSTADAPRLDQRGTVGRLVFAAPIDLDIPALGAARGQFLDAIEARDEGRELVFALGRGMTASRALSGPRQYVVEDWRGHRLSAPPRGYHWVQVGADYVLVAVATGIILQMMLAN